MIVRERPRAAVLFQAIRFPVEASIKRATDKVPITVPKGHYLLMASNGVMKVLHPSEYAARYEPLTQHFDCSGRQKAPPSVLTPEEIAALMFDDAEVIA